MITITKILVKIKKALFEKCPITVMLTVNFPANTFYSGANPRE